MDVVLLSVLVPVLAIVAGLALLKVLDRRNYDE